MFALLFVVSLHTYRHSRSDCSVTVVCSPDLIVALIDIRLRQGFAHPRDPQQIAESSVLDLSISEYGLLHLYLANGGMRICKSFLEISQVLLPSSSRASLIVLSAISIRAQYCSCTEGPTRTRSFFDWESMLGPSRESASLELLPAMILLRLKEEQH